MFFIYSFGVQQHVDVNKYIYIKRRINKINVI